MNDPKYNDYKKVTDAFHLLYNAFRESGFTKEEAFELVKCYCTSTNVQNMYNNLVRNSNRYGRMSKFKKGEEDGQL